MKHIYFRLLIVILTVFISSGLSAQDYRLFPCRMKAFYSSDVIDLISVRLDSVDVSTANKKYLFNINYDDNGIPLTCDSLNGISKDSLINTLVEVPYLMRNIVERNDTVFCSGLGINYFLPKINAGASWNVSPDIQITYDSVRYEQFLGLNDSVKYFTLSSTSSTNMQLNGLQYKLSKNYGFIEYPVVMSFPTTYNLAGIELPGGQQYGFSVPSFHSFFHLQASDILLWKAENDPMNIQDPGYTEYFHDSITQATVYADSVVYIIDRVTLNRYGNIVSTPGMRKVFLRSTFEKLFSNPDQSAVFTKPSPWYHQGSIPQWRGYASHNDQSNDFTFTIMSDARYIDTLQCSYLQIFDYGEHFILDTITGIRAYYEFSFGTYSETLSGYRVNGVEVGSIQLAVNEWSMPKLTCYPNPISRGDKLNFSTQVDAVILFDLSGKLILSSTASFDSSGLTAGSYILEVRRGSEMRRSLLVVL